MKKILFLVLFLANLVAFGQERKDFVMSFGLGVSNLTPKNTTQFPEKGISVGLDFDYYVAKRHAISVAYYFAHNTFFYDYSAMYDYGKNNKVFVYQNSDIYWNNFMVCYKLKLVEASNFNVLFGTGIFVSAFLHRTPTVIPRQNGLYDISRDSGGDISLGFPLKLDVNYWIHKNWALGVQTGVYYMPESPISAFIQPKISFCIQ